MEFETGGRPDSAGSEGSGGGAGTRPPGASASAGGEFDYRDPIRSFVVTVRRLVLEPVAFFRGMNRQGDFVNPLIFALICVLVWAFFSSLVSFSFALISGVQSVGGSLGRFVLSVIFYPLLGIAALFIGAAIYHLLVTLIVGQGKSAFESTFRVYAYACVTLLVAWIPILGWLAAPIWSIVLTIFGIREAHFTTTGKAALVVLILPAIALVLMVSLLLLVLLLTLLGLTSI